MVKLKEKTKTKLSGKRKYCSEAGEQQLPTELTSLSTSVAHLTSTQTHTNTRGARARCGALLWLTYRKKKHGIMGVNWLAGKMIRWPVQSVHVRAIWTHYAVIWEVMELEPARGTPASKGTKSGSTCCLFGGGGGGHRGLWVNLIGWFCAQTSLRAMKRGVCCTKLLWINVHTFCYHTHTHCRWRWLSAESGCVLSGTVSLYLHTEWRVDD